MNIKDRFTVYVNSITGTETIYDNKTKEVLSEIEADIIFQKEYGQYYSLKTKYIHKMIEAILAQMEYYNDNCEKGFEITIDDIIYKLRKEKV